MQWIIEIYFWVFINRYEIATQLYYDEKNLRVDQHGLFPKKTGRGIFDLMFESAANSLNQALREKSEFTRTGVSYLYQP